MLVLYLLFVEDLDDRIVGVDIGLECFYAEEGNWKIQYVLQINPICVCILNQDFVRCLWKWTGGKFLLYLLPK